MTIRVLVADDHAMVRTGFRLVLTTDPEIEVVGEAADGQEAVTLALRLRPNVVVIDLRMPVVDGVEATPDGRDRPPRYHRAASAGRAADRAGAGAGPGGGPRPHQRRDQPRAAHRVVNRQDPSRLGAA
jgi:CheY-like chemotaxis protein